MRNYFRVDHLKKKQTTEKPIIFLTDGLIPQKFCVIRLIIETVNISHLFTVTN